MKIIDTHAHLDHIENLEDALNNAAGAGVEAIVAMSMDTESCRKNLMITSRYSKPRLYLAMGMHPAEANSLQLDACVDLIREHKDKLFAIGEIGLDFWYKWVRKDQEKKDEQRRVFRRFLEVAQENHLPAVIHSRGTWKECLQTAQEIGLPRCVFHWYSGPLDVLTNILDAGYLVSTNPSLAYNPVLKEIANHVPMAQMLIETDSPVFFSNKETGTGFQSEPKDVFRTLEAYCQLKSVRPEEAVEVFNRNAKEFFKII